MKKFKGNLVSGFGFFDHDDDDDQDSLGHVIIVAPRDGYTVLVDFVYYESLYNNEIVLNKGEKAMICIYDGLRYEMSSLADLYIVTIYEE